MAVPFRAKDEAKEQTEFGHPDVMMGFTFVSWYRRGLRFKDFEEVLTLLLRSNMSESEAKNIYSTWIKELDLECNAQVDGVPIPRNLESINMEDKELVRDVLYPVFKRHMSVINFWLFKKVFPVQAKHFPYTVTSTAWDLCRKPNQRLNSKSSS